jgi:hypothetical protein
VFAKAAIADGELIATWGGTILTGPQLRDLRAAELRRCVQVDEDLYLWTGGAMLSPADLVNHSCEPNAGLADEVTIVAMRDIAAGEEICIDYAMCDGSQYDEFSCLCGTRRCRGRITGEDWRIPDLIERYWGFFAPYLRRRIGRFDGMVSPTDTALVPAPLQTDKISTQACENHVRPPRHRHPQAARRRGGAAGGALHR